MIQQADPTNQNSLLQSVSFIKYLVTYILIPKGLHLHYQTNASEPNRRSELLIIGWPHYRSHRLNKHTANVKLNNLREPLSSVSVSLDLQ